MNKHSDEDAYYSASDGCSSDADDDCIGEHHRKSLDNTHDAWPTCAEEEPNMNARNDTNEDRVDVDALTTTTSLAAHDHDMRVTQKAYSVCNRVLIASTEDHHAALAGPTATKNFDCVLDSPSAGEWVDSGFVAMDEVGQASRRMSQGGPAVEPQSGGVTGGDQEASTKAVEACFVSFATITVSDLRVQENDARGYRAGVRLSDKNGNYVQTAEQPLRRSSNGYTSKTWCEELQIPIARDAEGILLELLLLLPRSNAVNKSDRDQENKQPTSVDTMDPARSDCCANTSQHSSRCKDGVQAPCCVGADNDAISLRGEVAPIDRVDLSGTDGSQDLGVTVTAAAVGLMLSQLRRTWRTLESPLFDQAGAVVGRIRTAARITAPGEAALPTVSDHAQTGLGDKTLSAKRDSKQRAQRAPGTNPLDLQSSQRRIPALEVTAASRMEALEASIIYRGLRMPFRWSKASSAQTIDKSLRETLGITDSSAPSPRLYDVFTGLPVSLNDGKILSSERTLTLLAETPEWSQDIPSKDGRISSPVPPSHSHEDPAAGIIVTEPLPTTPSGEVMPHRILGASCRKNHDSKVPREGGCAAAATRTDTAEVRDSRSHSMPENVIRHNSNKSFCRGKDGYEHHQARTLSVSSTPVSAEIGTGGQWTSKSKNGNETVFVSDVETGFVGVERCDEQLWRRRKAVACLLLWSIVACGTRRRVASALWRWKLEAAIASIERRSRDEHNQDVHVAFAQLRRLQKEVASLAKASREGLLMVSLDALESELLEGGSIDESDSDDRRVRVVAEGHRSETSLRGDHRGARRMRMDNAGHDLARAVCDLEEEIFRLLGLREEERRCLTGRLKDACDVEIELISRAACTARGRLDTSTALSIGDKQSPLPKHSKTLKTNSHRGTSCGGVRSDVQLSSFLALHILNPGAGIIGTPRRKRRASSSKKDRGRAIDSGGDIGGIRAEKLDSMDGWDLRKLLWMLFRAFCDGSHSPDTIDSKGNCKGMNRSAFLSFCRRAKLVTSTRSTTDPGVRNGEQRGLTGDDMSAVDKVVVEDGVAQRVLDLGAVTAIFHRAAGVAASGVTSYKSLPAPGSTATSGRKRSTVSDYMKRRSSGSVFLSKRRQHRADGAAREERAELDAVGGFCRSRDCFGCGGDSVSLCSDVSPNFPLPFEAKGDSDTHRTSPSRPEASSTEFDRECFVGDTKFVLSSAFHPPPYRSSRRRKSQFLRRRRRKHYTRLAKVETPGRSTQNHRLDFEQFWLVVSDMAKMLVQTSVSDHGDYDLSGGSSSEGAEGFADVGGEQRYVVDAMKEGCHGGGEGGYVSGLERNSKVVLELARTRLIPLAKELVAEQLISHDCEVRETMALLDPSAQKVLEANMKMLREIFHHYCDRERKYRTAADDRLRRGGNFDRWRPSERSGRTWDGRMSPSKSPGLGIEDWMVFARDFGLSPPALSIEHLADLWDSACKHQHLFTTPYPTTTTTMTRVSTVTPPSAARSSGPAGLFADAAIVDGGTIHDMTALPGEKCEEDDCCRHNGKKAGRRRGVSSMSRVLRFTGFVDLLGRCALRHAERIYGVLTRRHSGDENGFEVDGCGPTISRLSPDQAILSFFEALGASQG